MKAYLCYIVLLLSIGCVEPFTPVIEEYDKVLVVDGLLSNSDRPTTVILSESISLDDQRAQYVSGAQVTIEDDQGVLIPLQEIKPGFYQSDSTTFRGEIGKSYRLHVTLNEGDQFESEWELMKPAPPIDNIEVEFLEIMRDNPDSKPIQGAQFYLNTKNTEGSTKYYRWEWEETYIYRLPHPKFLQVEFSDNPGDGNDRFISLSGPNFEGFDCYKTERSSEIIVATTESLIGDEIKDFPLRYIDNSGSQLYSRYSLLAKQYALSKEYFEFLSKLEEVNESTGGLFDPIPNEVFGNMKYVGNINLPVLGYFAVAGVSESRIFVERPEIPDEFGARRGPGCLRDTVELDVQVLHSRLRSNQMVLYDYHYSLFGDILGYLIAEPQCTSCADYNATNKVPEFW